MSQYLKIMVAALAGLLPAVQASAQQAVVHQSTAAGVASQGNVAVIRQTGGENSITIHQQGMNNQLDAVQHGTDNFADVMQAGGENQLSLTQAGENNSLIRKQTGHTQGVVNQDGVITVIDE